MDCSRSGTNSGGPIGKFLRLDPDERRRLLRAVRLLCVLRAALWVVPFAKVRGAVERSARKCRPSSRRPSVDEVVWTVKVGSRYVPRATCLTQALAARVMLAREGYDNTLRIGVARGERGQLQAHAWVEYEGRVVIGETDVPDRFTPLPPL